MTILSSCKHIPGITISGRHLKGEIRVNAIGDIIAENRKKQGLTQSQLATKLSLRGITVSPKTISSWEKGNNEPGIRAFAEICLILEVPDLYEALYGHNPFDKSTLLNAEGRDKLQDYLSLLLASHQYDESTPGIIPISRRRIKLFHVYASAGTGNFLEESSFEWIEVGSEVPQKADFGIQIAGDSMEPRYVNQQIVWVHSQETLSSGEIGIFFYNGDAYCKKLSEDADGLFLISLNQKYAPMRVRTEDNFKIFGKVLN